MLNCAVAPSLPASAVTHSVSGRLASYLPAESKHLVIVAENHVTVYETSFRSAADADDTTSRNDLVFLSEVSLHAPPVAVQLCRPRGSTEDHLVMLFDDFHLSFLQLNPLSLQLETVALVQLDERPLNGEQHPLPGILRVDPSGHCVTVLAKRCQLYVFEIGQKVPRADAEVLTDTHAQAGVTVATDTTATSNTAAATTHPATGPDTRKGISMDAWDDDEDDEDDEESTSKEAERKIPEDVAKQVASTSEEQDALAKQPNSLQQNANALSSDFVLLLSPVTSFHLSVVKDTLRNVRDFAFVESAGDLLLAMLSEPVPSWAGRSKVVDWRSGKTASNILTSSVFWIKITQEVNAPPRLLYINEVEGIPYHATHMCSVRAFGHIPSGVICVSMNSVIHVSLKNACGAYFNKNGQEETADCSAIGVTYDPLRWENEEQASSHHLMRTNVNLSNATVVPLNDWSRLETALSVKRSGSKVAEEAKSAVLELLIVSEDAGTVLRVRLDGSGHTLSHMSGVITDAERPASSWALLAPRTLFVGSALGDSSIVRVSPDGSLETLHHIPGLGQLRDVETVNCTRDLTEVNNRIIDPTIEDSPFAELFHEVALDPDPALSAVEKRNLVDLAACGGSGSLGFLAFLRNSVRDIPLQKKEISAKTLFMLTAPVASNGQAVARLGQKRGRTVSEEDSASLPGSANDQPNSFMIMTDETFTILLRVTTDSIQQVNNTALNTSRRTVFATVLPVPFENSILQVCEREVRLVASDGTSTISSLLLSHEELKKLMPELPATFAVTEAALIDSADLTHSGAGERLTRAPKGSESSRSVLLLHLDDGSLLCVLVHELLQLGSSGGQLTSLVHVLDHGVKSIAVWNRGPSSSPRLFLARDEDLVVCVIDIATAATGPTLKKMDIFPGFGLMPPLAISGVPHEKVALRAALEKEPLSTVTHMAVYSHEEQHKCSNGDNTGIATVPSSKQATLALILDSGELITYQVHRADGARPLRMVKHLHHLLDVEPQFETFETIAQKRIAQQRAKNQQLLQRKKVRLSARLVPFDDINGYRGLYVCGNDPVFLLHDRHRDELSLCRHRTTGLVYGFAPFTFPGPHATTGYVYCANGSVQFATMQPFGQYLSHGWWMQRVPLPATPHQLVYNAPSQTCVVVTATEEPFSPQKAPFDVQLKTTRNPIDGTSTTAVIKPQALPALSPETGAPVPLNERYQLHCVSCVTFGVINVIPLERNEKVLCATSVYIVRDLSQDVTPLNPLAPVCAVATAFPLGEDVTTRGRLLLLAARRRSAHSQKKNVDHGTSSGEEEETLKTPEDEHHHERLVGSTSVSCSEMRVMHSEPLKGPATAVTGVRGAIAVAVGGTVRVMRYDWETRTLETMAMLYAGAYVTKLSAFREYLLIGGLYDSLLFTRFSALAHTLTVLGGDIYPFSVVDCNMLYRGDTCALVATDDQRNLALYSYEPTVTYKSTASTTEAAGAADGGANESAQQQQQQTRVIKSILSLDTEFRCPSGCVFKTLRFSTVDRGLAPTGSLNADSADAGGATSGVAGAVSNGNLEDEAATAASTMLFATNYGAIGYMVPISPKIHQTAKLLSRFFQHDLPHAAGLTPEMFLSFSQQDPLTARRGAERALYYPLLTLFFMQDLRVRKLIAARITKVDKVLSLAATIQETGTRVL